MSTICGQLKLYADDGKKYLSNVINEEGVKTILSSMKTSPVDPKPIFSLFKKALINDINNRDIFMKGIDCSYYYEED